MFLSKNRVVLNLGKLAVMQATRDFSHYVKDAGRGPLPHRPGGRGRQLRRLHVEDRARAFGDTRRHAGARQPDRPPRGAGMEAGRARSRPLHRPARRARLQGLSVRDRGRGSRRGRAIALSAALPRRRGVRHHERDDAVDSGVVRQCQRHAAGAARFLSLAVGADRAAGRGLCRPAVLPLGLARACARATSTWTCRSRSASSSRSACRWSRPSTTPSTPISTRRSCC